MKIETSSDALTHTHSFRITADGHTLWAARGFATSAYRDRSINIACAALRGDPPTRIDASVLTPTCAAILSEYVKRRWRNAL